MLTNSQILYIFFRTSGAQRRPRQKAVQYGHRDGLPRMSKESTQEKSHSKVQAEGKVRAGIEDQHSYIAQAGTVGPKLS